MMDFIDSASDWSKSSGKWSGTPPSPPAEGRDCSTLPVPCVASAFTMSSAKARQRAGGYSAVLAVLKPPELFLPMSGGCLPLCTHWAGRGPV